jgi:hypothetical protein
LTIEPRVPAPAGLTPRRQRRRQAGGWRAAHRGAAPNGARRWDVLSLANQAFAGRRLSRSCKSLGISVCIRGEPDVRGPPEKTKMARNSCPFGHSLARRPPRT